MLSTLDGARCAIQVDVGYGDAVTPAGDSVVFPVLLDEMPPPLLRSYPVYTLVAEKYQAMVSLGIVLALQNKKIAHLQRGLFFCAFA